MKTKKRILVAPLDWGIGHATRCIPIIDKLIEHKFEVIIAAYGRSLDLLKIEYPNLEFICFPGYNIKYSKYLPMSINILSQTPKIFSAIKKEHFFLNKIIDEYKIDGVISDNRFGLYSKKVKNVFITHQLEIQSLFFSKIIKSINYNYINKYDACWIVDDPTNNIAGKLSNPHALPNNAKYIGSLSRFKNIKKEKKYAFLAIISGPEPQRTLLEKQLISSLKKRSEKALIVLGQTEKNESIVDKNIAIKSHLRADELNNAIAESELIICRSGYSTIMDLIKMQKKAIFIPTPGQTEQEYLAKILKEKKLCFYQNQNKFNLDEAIEKNKKYSGLQQLKNYTTNWQELFSLF